MGSKILAGRYELLEKKGDGGMAVVYKAKDRLLNRFVAIKILKPEYIRDPKFIDSFRRESQNAAGLSHPNIVSVYDVGKEGNIYYIVMELLDGETLSDMIQREAPMDETKAASIASQIAAGLSAAHKNKIIHRDVKPHNILFAEDGTVKITDFGIAKAVNSSTIVNTTTTTVMGSVHYLSPEQARGGYLDEKSDIYSLGIVIYEMLTGKVPFDGENPVTVAMMHINDDVPAPSLENPKISPYMDQIVTTATKRSPGERFASADEMAEALNQTEQKIALDQKKKTQVFKPATFLSSTKLKNKEKNKEKNREKTKERTKERKKDKSKEKKNGKEKELQGTTENGFRDLDNTEENKLKRRRFRNPKDEEKKQEAVKKAAIKAEKRRYRRSVTLGVLLALICAIPLSLLIFNSCDGLGSESIQIPKLIGMTESEASETLSGVGLEYKLGTAVVSTEYDSGKVVSTDPKEGDTVRRGYKVTLILSRGAGQTNIEVPDLTGKSLEEAVKVLENNGLVKGKVTYEESDEAEDTVITQSPSEGEIVDGGTKISLMLSKGQSTKMLEVPDLSGMTEKEAEAALEGIGLRPGRVSERDADAPEGVVVEQSREAGSEVEESTRVNIVVSTGASLSEETGQDEDAEETQSESEQKGKNKTKGQSVEITKSSSKGVSCRVDYSEAPSDAFHLTVAYTDQTGYHTVINNELRNKSTGSQSFEVPGTGQGTVYVIMEKVRKEIPVDFDEGIAQ